MLLDLSWLVGVRQRNRFKNFSLRGGETFCVSSLLFRRSKQHFKERAEKRASALARADKEPAFKPAAGHGDLKKVRLVRPTKKQAAKGQIAVTIKCPGLRE